MKKILLAAVCVASLLGGYALAQTFPVNYAAGFSIPQDNGITAARGAYNTANPAATIATNQAYVQFVMTRASQSYCAQYAVAGC